MPAIDPEAQNKRRKDRYANDPIYRDRMLAWSREFKKQRRLATKVDPQRNRKATGAAAQWKTTEVEIDGVVTSMFTLGALAKIFGKGMSTLRMWEATGVLPKTPHRSERGDRLYTYEQVAEMRAQLIEKGRIHHQLMKGLERPRAITKPVRMDDGVVRNLTLYRVRSLAEALDKTTTQLWTMEHDRIIPETPLRASSLKHRLYTASMITSLKEVLERYGWPYLQRSRTASLREIPEKILEEWAKLGLRSAQVVEDKDARKSSNGSGGAGDPIRKLFGHECDAAGRRIRRKDGASDNGNGAEAVQEGAGTGTD